MEELVAAKKNWSDEERLELAAKLDAELDSFIDGLEKKRYEEGWPEDRWQEEMDKHPFFMKRAPQPGDEVHPMFEGLQKLKYDPEENTRDELALNYKEDGNFYMKHKKFRMAVYSFTEGIKTKCENPDVLAVLYNNRSAAHYFLKNFRSALSDAQRALTFKPDYTKARWRGAQCAYELEKYDICTQLCEQLLEVFIDHQEAKALLHKNKMKKLEAERNQRKEATEAKRRLGRFHKLRDALQQRAVKFDDLKPNQHITEDLLRPKFLPLEEFSVHFDDDGTSLIWPAAFSYPEFMFSDFQQQLPETATLTDCLASLFAESLSRDKTGTYSLGNVSVYYENRKVGCVQKAELNKTLRDIISRKDFFVSGGTLLFYIVPTGSRIEQEFIHEKRWPMVYS